MNWVAEELSDLYLNDKRLEKRAKEVLGKLFQSPNASIPCAFSSWSETYAAYRLIGNDKVSASKIITPHIKSTIERVNQHNTVLMVQDTTEIFYATHHKKQGIGPIHSENAKGLMLHPTLAITPERLCLGVVDDYSWYRDELHRKKDHKSKPIEDKESYRWLLSYRLSNEIAKQSPDTKIINVADREGDIYEIFKETSESYSETRADWIIRSAQNRVLESKDKVKQKIWQEVKSQPSVGEINFNMQSRSGVGKRQVKQAIRYKKVEIQCPKTKKFDPVELTVVIASESNPPVGEKAIEWVLLTSLDVRTAKQAIEVVEHYLCRWQIEVYFKVLKSGCNIEKKQFIQEDNLNTCIRLYMIIAWRILYLTMLGRSCPDISCEHVFELYEWQSVYLVVNKGALPKQPPTLNEILEMIAILGGYIKKKGSPAGVKTMWQGIKRMHDFVLAWQALDNMKNEQKRCV